MVERSPLPTPPDIHTPGWLWRLPRLSFVSFIAVVVALLWLSDRSDREEQRATLISDMLWLEQGLHFVLKHNEELIGQINSPGTGPQTTFDAHVRTLIGNQTGLTRVRWLPPQALGQTPSASSDASDIDQDSVRLSQSLGRPVYGNPRADVRNEWLVDVYVPIFLNEGVAGIVVGTYSLRRLLEETIPWWLTERYRIVIVNTDGTVLASRSKVEAPDTDTSYQIAFDPPGRGLSLEATPYSTPPLPAGKLLSGSLILLALVVLWSLWALRRHIQRRLVAESALRDEHAFRKAMEDSVQTGLRARDPEGRITYVNPAFCAMVGWTAEELVGRKPPMPYWVDEDIAATQALHDRILAGEGPERGFEVRFKRRNGEVFPALIHEAPLIDADGRHTGWMSSIIDLTDQKKAEDIVRQQSTRLQAASRLVTMGEMASSLAHELNQPLAAIAIYNSGCLNQLRSEHRDIKGIEEALNKSTEQAQRAGRIIRRIYEFVRRSEPKSEACNIGRLLEDIIAMVEDDSRHHAIHIQRDIPAPLPAIWGDHVLLSQVFLNLIRNAMEATQDETAERRALSVSASASDAAVTVRIADRGHGITPDIAERLFEPFFTTKTEGMGMGLNICRTIVEAHYGRLWYEPNPLGGSIFLVQLPRQSQ